LNQSEPNVILTAHATKVNRPEPNWTEPQTCLAGRNHALCRCSVAPRYFPSSDQQLADTCRDADISQQRAL